MASDCGGAIASVECSNRKVPLLAGRHQRWTPREVEILKSEWPTHRARADIAKQLNRTVSACQCKAKEFNLAHPRLEYGDCSIQILSFVCEDCGAEGTRERRLTANGHIYGGQRSPLRCRKCKKKRDWKNQAARRGTKPRTDFWPQEKIDRAKSLWAEGLSSTEIASILGFKTRNPVVSMIWRSGLRRKDKATRTKSPKARKPRPLRAPIVRAVVPPPTPALPIPEAHERIALTDLKLHHCKAICNDGDHSTKRYCGRNVAYRSYCSDHATAYYQRRA